MDQVDRYGVQGTGYDKWGGTSPYLISRSSKGFSRGSCVALGECWVKKVGGGLTTSCRLGLRVRGVQKRWQEMQWS